MIDSAAIIFGERIFITIKSHPTNREGPSHALSLVACFSGLLGTQPIDYTSVQTTKNVDLELGNSDHPLTDIENSVCRIFVAKLLKPLLSPLHKVQHYNGIESRKHGGEYDQHVSPQIEPRAMNKEDSRQRKEQGR